MQMGRMIFLACCTMLCAGCHVAQRPSARHWVYLTVGSDYGVFLHSGGGARIDDSSSIGPVASGYWFRHTVIVPCSSSEVERLAETIARLIDMGAARPIGVSAHYEGRRSFVLRCGTPKGTREAQFNQLDIDMNLVWHGVMREIDAVGHIALAEGIVAFLAAEQAQKEGDHMIAHARYAGAVKEVVKWGSVRSNRIQGMLYEPGPFVMAEKASDPDAIPYLVKAWKLVTEEEIRMERHGGMTTVWFTERCREKGLAEGMPAQVPEGVLRELKERQRPRN